MFNAEWKMEKKLQLLDEWNWIWNRTENQCDDKWRTEKSIIRKMRSIEITRESTLRRNARGQVFLSKFHVEPLNSEGMLEHAAFNVTFIARSGRSIPCDNFAIASANFESLAGGPRPRFLLKLRSLNVRAIVIGIESCKALEESRIFIQLTRALFDTRRDTFSRADMIFSISTANYSRTWFIRTNISRVR